MTECTSEEYAEESQSPSVQGMPGSQHCLSGDSLPEWRSSEQVDNGNPSTSPSYFDTDDDGDSASAGPRPSELCGKFTWKIEDFSEINKRELRSSIFEVGGYKWYILIYPQGCDVCNHLSLFLCVANHDKLLPGWSHFAQFTIAVVNKDSKKSKYSDTLHRFWKKEHDWGWKKFMEVTKVSEGFLVDDALVIKAQVQVIREKTHCPFRCLDYQYRRELVRVYLSSVEQLCRRYVEEKRGKFSKMIDDKIRWSSFHTFWLGVDQNARQQMSRDKSESILKVVVKHFFVENEVTSTLVMDYLYSGLKVLECQSKSRKGRAQLFDLEEMPAPLVHVEKDVFVLTDDVLLLLERAALEPLPPKDEKGSQNQNRMKEGSCGEESSKDSIQHDERRLTELGRRTVEIFALNHIFSGIEVAYQEAIALRRQEELIREEEAAGQAENELKSKRSAAEKEKRTKKKQTKQKKGSRKCKDRGRDDNHDATVRKSHEESSFRERMFEVKNQSLSVLEKAKMLTDVSDMSDIGGDVAEILQSDLGERDASSISWDTDVSEIHHTVEARDTELQNVQVDKRWLSVIDDSSSTCSSDSVPSVLMNGIHEGNAYSNKKTLNSHSRVKNQQSKSIRDLSDTSHSDTEKLQADSTSTGTILCDTSGSCRAAPPESEAVAFSLNDQMQQLEQHLVKEEQVTLQKKPSNNDQVHVDGPSRSVMTEKTSNPTSPIKNPSISEQSKQTSESSIITANPVTIRNLSSNSKLETEKLVPTPSRLSSISKPKAKATVDTKINTIHQSISAVSRPSSAPLIPGPKPASPPVFTAQAVSLSSHTESVAAQLGVDSSPPTQSKIPHSYRNAIICGRTTVSTNTHSFTHHSSCFPSRALASSQSSPPDVSSASALVLQKSAIMEPSTVRPGLTFGSVNPEALQPQCLWTEESLQMEPTSNLMHNDNLVCDAVEPYFSGTCCHAFNLDELSSGLSFHQVQGQGVTLDEFPHLDIINDLLNEEQSVGEVAANGYLHHPDHTLQQYTFSDDAYTAADNVMSNRNQHFDRLDLYYVNQVQRVYGSSSSLDGRRGLTSMDLNLSAYVNSQIGGGVQNQWPVGIADHSVVSLGSTESNGYSYHLHNYSNLSCELDGYNVYRPANGY
uniref:MATH domain-containing protein At5g43560 n=2 Tax=Anthurium amnicola TaxID=1678845 RepID=A0A1D1YJH6_9ARAE